MWVTWIEMITFSKCSQNVTLFSVITLKRYLCTVWRPFLSCLLPLCQDKCSCSWNHSYEKVFRLQFYIYANQTRFHMASLALGLQRSLPKEVSDSIRRILWCMLKFRGYNWSNNIISNTSDSVSSDFQTTRRELKIRRAVEFLRNSRCLDSRWNTVSSIQTSFTVVISFVLTWWIIYEFENVLS